MSRFKKLSHAVWHYTYHIVWTPKYRYRILKGCEGKDILSPFRGYLEAKSFERGCLLQICLQKYTN